MGSIDVESRKYLSAGDIFADVFNYLLFDGEKVLIPENLRPADSSESAAPYGNGARIPVQRYRDILKIWTVMEDGNAVYILLGEEVQTHVHYAMPVRNMLYDSLNYAAQVEEAGRSYKRKKDCGDLFVEDGQVKIRLSSEEFLSGFRKQDKLMPVITAVVYLGDDKWDGPRSIHEMLDVENKRVLSAVPDYRIHLLEPVNIAEEDFAKFHTDLGLALRVLKHQNDEKIVEILMSTEYRTVGRNTAEFLNAAADLKLEYIEADTTEEGIDMCKGMEKYTMRIKAEGKAEGKIEGIDKACIDNIRTVMRKTNYTVAQAMEFLDIPADDRQRYLSMI